MIAAVILLVSSIFAWFSNTVSKPITTINGHVIFVPEYFAYGDGTEDNPYIISEPEHLKNLAWLQYLGYFNQEEDDGTVKTTYFKIAALDDSGEPSGKLETLDMSNWVIPPIGTSKYPFVGNFDGNGTTIKGLTVTNTSNRSAYTYVKDGSTVVHTPKEVEGIEDVNIIGLFGVIGNTDKTNFDYTTNANVVKDFHISQTTVKTQTATTLIGIAAGYVNGTLDDIGIVDSDIVDSVGSAATSYTSDDNKLSKYSSVGYCTSDYEDSVDIKSVDISKPTRDVTEKETVIGGGAAWGNSIYMKDFYNRMKTMYGQASNIKYYTEVTQYTDINKNVTEINKSGEQTNPYIKNYNSQKEGSVTFSNPSSGTESGLQRIDYYLMGKTKIDIDIEGAVRHVQEEYYSDSSVTIQSGKIYLGVDASQNVAASTDAVGWQFSDKENKEGTLKTPITKEGKDVYYYLNRSGVSGLVLSTTASTNWYCEDNEIYCVSDDGNTYYYLVYSDGKWSLKAKTAEYFYISQKVNGTTYYMAFEDDAIKAVSNKRKASKWHLDDNNRVYTGNKETYLVCSGSTLTYGNADDGTMFDVTHSGNTLGLNYDIYYVNCNSTPAWELAGRTVTGVRILDEYHSQYLNINSSHNGVTNTQTQSDATYWMFEGSSMDSFKIYTSVGNTKYYLGFTGSDSANNITITNESGAKVFSLDDNKIICDYNGNELRLYYSSYYYISLFNWYTGWRYGYASDNLGVDKTMTFEYRYKTHTNLTYTNASDPFVNDLTITETGSGTPLIKTLDDEKGYYETPETYLPLSAASSSPYNVDESNNTGYYVSGSQYLPDTETFEDSGDMRVTTNSISAGWLSRSIGNTLGISYSGSTFWAVTCMKDEGKDTATYYRIDDDYNTQEPGYLSALRTRFTSKEYGESGLNLQRYATARTNLHNLLSNDSENRIYGLKFNKSEVSTRNLVTADEVTVLQNNQKKTYTNYQMPRSCIDFNVQTAGYVNLFAASFDSNNDTFFTLHQIVRDSDNKITQVREIIKIFEVSDGKYEYQYGDGSYSGNGTHTNDTLVFNMNWIKNPNNYISDGLLRETCYYFEIPIGKGEYALGGAGTSKDSASLIYLDIGANSQKVTDTVTNEVINETVDTYMYPKGVDFQSSTSSSLTDVTADSAMSVAVTGNTANINYSRDGSTVTTSSSSAVECVYEAEGITVKNGSTELEPVEYIENSTLTGITTEEIKNTSTQVVESTESTKIVLKYIDGTYVSDSGRKFVKSGDGDYEEKAYENETIEQGTVALSYYYYIPDTEVTSSYTLDATYNIETNTYTDKYIIIETSDNVYNMYIDKLLDVLKTSTINGCTITQGQILASNAVPNTGT